MLILGSRLEWQDREAESAARFCNLIRLAETNPRDPNGLSDALQCLRADPFDAKIRRGCTSVKELVGKANAARIVIGRALVPCRLRRASPEGAIATGSV